MCGFRGPSTRQRNCSTSPAPADNADIRSRLIRTSPSAALKFKKASAAACKWERAEAVVAAVAVLVVPAELVVLALRPVHAALLQALQVTEHPGIWRLV